jgi:uncharacterized membrane protein YfcA
LADNHRDGDDPDEPDTDVRSARGTAGPAVSWAGIVLIGLSVGFLAGLFGKGGSAVATPLLHAIGIPAIVALAAPLPAAIPSTLAATGAYWRHHLVDREVLFWSLIAGVPATVAGAIATRWVSGSTLVSATDVLLALLGLRFLFRPAEGRLHQGAPGARRTRRLRLVCVAGAVGLASGLLANSGGFLLAPLYLVVLRLPVKSAFASSLAVAAALALPGTIVHWALGHIDWAVVAVFGAASVPLSYVGARVALRTEGQRLERVYGAVLALLGVGLLVVG